MFQPPCGKSHIKQKESFAKPKEEEKERNSFNPNGRGTWVWLPGLPARFTRPWT